MENIFTQNKMMKYLALILSVLIISCKQRDSFLFLGDSITEGYNGSIEHSPKRWSKQVADAMGMNEINLGKGGTVFQRDSTGCVNSIFDSTLIPTYDSTIKKLFIAYGINDIRYNNGVFTPVAYGERLSRVVDYAKARGWAPANIILITPYWEPDGCYTSITRDCPINTFATEARHEAYVEQVRTVAQNKKVLVVDVYSEVKSDADRYKYLSKDSVHYNDFGNTQLATYLIKWLKQT